jgi:caffeoyl-CoA O-methyltransferase
MDFLPASISHYAEVHTTPESDLLKTLNRETHLKTLQPRMLSGHLQGRLLSFISKSQRPRRILEIGTFTGYATLCLAEGLTDDGILYTIEANDELKPMIEKYFHQAPQAHQLRLIIGNALEIIPTLDELFDIVFIDAGKRDYPAYFDLVIHKVVSGGIIIADNILWSGKVTLDNKDIDTQIIDAFNKKMRADTRLECILLPIRDGLMMMRKK